MTSPVFVRAAFGSGSFSNQCDVTINLTGVDTLICWAWSNSGSSLTTPTSAAVDPAGANVSMTAGTNRDGPSVADVAGNLRSFAVTGLSLTGSKTVRITLSDGNTNSIAWVAGYSGGTAISAEVQNTATSGALSSTSVSSATGSLVAGFFGQYGSDDTTTWTPGTGVTLDYDVLSADVNYWRGVIWSKAGGTSVTVDGTVSPGFHWASSFWSITGSSATNYSLTSAQGSYTVSGQDATLTKITSGVSYTLTASQGTYLIVGQDSQSDFATNSLSGTYTITGQSATLTFLHTGPSILTADFGSYSLSGQSANLVSTQAILYSLPASFGTYTLIGKRANLLMPGDLPSFGPGDKFVKLALLGYTGSLNDMLLKYYRDGGATSTNLNEAEMQWLALQGATAFPLNMRRRQFYVSLGYTGTNNDMEYQYWWEL